MSRSFLFALATVAVTGGLIAQDGPQRGTLKKIDAAKATVSITANGKDHEFTVTARTRLMDSSGAEIGEGLKDKRFREGAPVMFRAAQGDGQTVLLGVRLGDGQRPGGPEGGDIRRARIKKIDLEKMILTLTSGERDHEFAITPETQVLGASGKDLKERLQDFKEGSEVFFKSGSKDGTNVVLGLKLADENAPDRPAQPVSPDTSQFKPLTELGSDEYHGFRGGLYPDGKNQRPAAHETTGVELARHVQPLDADGQPDRDGKTVLLSIGMSNTTQEFSLFKQLADSDKDKHPRLVIVDGAQGGMAAAQIVNPEDNGSSTKFWSTVDERLRNARVTREQVQAAWVKQADIAPNRPFPKHAEVLQQELAGIVQLLHERFPNLKLVYLSSRTYGGYARTKLNPEPYAYESGFAVKWLIEQQLSGDLELNSDPTKGPARAPWLSWGPYLWANGTTPRADGFCYEEGDFAGDGTHPSQSGRQKVAQQLLKFFKADSTTKPWFVASPGGFKPNEVEE